MNLQFHYIYRDGSNYKNAGSIILTGVPKDIKDFEAKLRKAFETGEYFIASQIDVPEVFLYTKEYNVDEDDHSWHEFTDITATQEEPNDSRTPAEFLQKVESQAQEGWKTFEPCDHPNANIKTAA